MRSFATLSLLASTALGHALPRAEEQVCSDCVVRTIVFEMGPPPPSATADAIPPPVQSPPVHNAPKPGHNSTTTLGPCGAPDIDVNDVKNIIPSQKISLYWGDGAGHVEAAAAPAPFTNTTSNAGNSTTVVPTAAPQGQVNMTLSMNHYVVALEYIGSIAAVECSDDLLTVTFSDAAAFADASTSWALEEELIMVTNHMGGCDAEFERGFFAVEAVTADASTLSLSCAASKTQIETIAADCEMTFSSLPAATLTKRITLDPSVSLTFAESLDAATTLFDLEPYLSVTADEAAFTSTVTFSGYLHYDFWKFKVTKLYFDIDASFEADLGVSASVQAAFAQAFTYAPDALSYSLVNVPGIVSLGPGVAFGIGLNLSVDAAVDISTHLGVALPGGNVHVDFLDGGLSSATGWEPTYTATANISEKATVGADVSASLEVELAIKVLGGLLDLSSGLRATPGVTNTFTLESTQVLDDKAGISFPANNTNAATCDQGVGIKSDFTFDLTGYVTQFYEQSLYSVTVPIADECYSFV